MLTPEEQLAAIQTKAFYTSLQAQAGTILSAFQSANFTITGDGWVETVVSDVPVWFQIRDTDLFFRVGQQEDQTYIYEWRAPKAWVL